MDINYHIELVDTDKENNMSDINNPFIQNQTVIKVVGVGNGGCNAVNRMIEDGLEGVSFIAMNTDSQALSRSKAETKLVLGERITNGLGAGTDPERGAEAAKEDISKIEEMLKGADLVFIASGFGGGTGTGASPVVADVAKRLGALTIGVVTKPFEMEGKLKMTRAVSGIEKMMNYVDSLIVIPNENLYKMIDSNVTFEQALSIIDDILRQGVQGISDIITQTGFGINVDFADVKTMISISNGRAYLSIGVGKGDLRLKRAAENAFNNPLLDVSSIRNAKGILANILCPSDFGLNEYKEVSQIISQYASSEANIKIGICKKESLKDEIRITIIATGFDTEKKIIEDRTTFDTSLTKDNSVLSDDIDETNKQEGYINEADVNEEERVYIRNFVKPLVNTVVERNTENIKQQETKREAERKFDISKISENKNYNAEVDKTEYTKEDIINKLKDEIKKENVKTEPLHIIETNREEVGEHNVENSAEKKRYPFEIISEKDMETHTLRGAKVIFGETVEEEIDYDVPAFLRRTIQTKKTL